MTRYVRQAILPEVGAAGQARLAAARVLVVGCGGLGSAVIPTLAGAGVGGLHLVDPDRVELGNLHRQLIYRMADLGRPKARCAAAAVSALNPEVAPLAEVIALTPANAAELVQAADLVVDAADSFAVTYTLSDACHAAARPLISASVLGRGGYVGGFCGGAPSYRAVFPDLPQRAASCAEAGVMGPVVAALGAVQAQMALATMLGLSPAPLGQLMRLDLAGWRSSGFRFDGAVEQPGPPFVAREQITAEDRVIDLRPVAEAPEPAHPAALRLDPAEIDSLTAEARRTVLACATGLRAWRAANRLAAKGQDNLALLAAR